MRAVVGTQSRLRFAGRKSGVTLPDPGRDRLVADDDYGAAASGRQGFFNTTIRTKRPDATREYEKRMGKKVNDIWPEEDLFVMHRVPFRHGITHVENLGGDVEQVLNKRCMIGAFPIPIEGGEASPCRIVAFVDE